MTRRTLSLLRLRRGRDGMRILRTAAMLAASASIAGVAIAAADGGPAPAPAPAVPEHNDAVAITAPDADQLATLGILRREAEAADAAPDGVWQLIARGSGPGLGANPDLARRALTTALGESLYVVPARGWVCLTSSSGQGSCTPTDRIADGYAVGVAAIPSGFRLSGLVPDGVARVEVRGAGGATAAATPSGNAWQADVVFAPTTVAWSSPHGDREVPVAIPATGPPAPPGG
jgi:hypothetical protein